MKTAFLRPPSDGSGLKITPNGIGIQVDNIEYIETVDQDVLKIVGGSNRDAAAPALGHVISGAVDANRPPVGPLGQFTGPYRPGIDRRPTDAEQLYKNTQGWFSNVDDDRSGTDERLTYAPPFSKTVGFVAGGVTQIGNGGVPSTQRTRITGCEAVLTAYALGSFPVGAKVGIELGSVGDVGNVSGTFAIAPEAGPVVGDNILWTITGNTVSAQVVIDAESAGKPLFLNAHYTSANPDQFIQVAAY